MAYLRGLGAAVAYLRAILKGDSNERFVFPKIL